MNLNSKYLICGSTSKGNQEKYKAGNVWYKADMLGYEALSEAVISCILKDNGVDCIDYKVETIQRNSQTKIASASKHFLKEDEILVTVYRMTQLLDFNQKEFDRASIEKRICYIVDIVKAYTELDNYVILEYFCKLLLIDSIFLNEDRHLANISFVYNSTTYSWCPAPIFDNGASLLSDIEKDYPLELSIDRAIRKVKAKPFSTDFQKQLEAIKKIFLIENPIKFIDFAKIRAIVEDSPYESEIKNRIIKVLKVQAMKHDIEITNNFSQTNKSALNAVLF